MNQYLLLSIKCKTICLVSLMLMSLGQKKWNTDDSELTKQKIFTLHLGAMLRGWSITDEFRINPKRFNTFRLLFDIKAFDPDTTDFSVAVTLRNFNHKALSWRRKTGWWHYYYPIVYKQPSNEYETIIVEFPHKEIDLTQIPSQARFIQFGVLINHSKGNSANGRFYIWPTSNSDCQPIYYDLHDKHPKQSQSTRFILEYSSILQERPIKECKVNYAFNIMMDHENSKSSVSRRRKIMTTTGTFTRWYKNSFTPREETETDLRPNLLLSSFSLPSQIIENKSIRISKSLAEKALLVPNKQNIDYQQLFDRKIGLRGSKLTFVPANRPKNQLKQNRKTQQKQVKIRISPTKNLQRKKQAILQTKIDLSVQTIGMLKGLNEKDLHAFLLLLDKSEQQRKRRALEHWQGFNSQRFAKLYCNQQLD